MPVFEARYRADTTLNRQSVTVERMQQYLRLRNWQQHKQQINNLFEIYGVSASDEEINTALGPADQTREALQHKSIAFVQTKSGRPVTEVTSKFHTIGPTVDIRQYETDSTKRHIGLCHGLSLIASSLKQVGRDAWWFSVLHTINRWNAADPSALESEITLHGKTYQLGHLFDIALNFTALNQGDNSRLGYASLSEHAHGQASLRRSDGYFEFVGADNDVHHIKQSAHHAQRFNLSSLKQFLDANKSNFQNHIVTIDAFSHTCSAAYDATHDKWLFYDPNYNEGKWKTFTTSTELAHEIASRYGMGLSLQFDFMSTQTTPIVVTHELSGYDDINRIQGGALWLAARRYHSGLVQNILHAALTHPILRRELVDALLFKRLNLNVIDMLDSHESALIENFIRNIELLSEDEACDHVKLYDFAKAIKNKFNIFLSDAQKARLNTASTDPYKPGTLLSLAQHNKLSSIDRLFEHAQYNPDRQLALFDGLLYQGDGHRSPMSYLVNKPEQLTKIITLMNTIMPAAHADRQGKLLLLLHYITHQLMPDSEFWRPTNQAAHKDLIKIFRYLYTHATTFNAAQIIALHQSICCIYFNITQDTKELKKALQSDDGSLHEIFYLFDKDPRLKKHLFNGLWKKGEDGKCILDDLAHLPKLQLKLYNPIRLPSLFTIGHFDTVNALFDKALTDSGCRQHLLLALEKSIVLTSLKGKPLLLEKTIACLNMHLIECTADQARVVALITETLIKNHSNTDFGGMKNGFKIAASLWQLMSRALQSAKNHLTDIDNNRIKAAYTHLAENVLCYRLHIPKALAQLCKIHKTILHFKAKFSSPALQTYNFIDLINASNHTNKTLIKKLYAICCYSELKSVNYEAQPKIRRALEVIVSSGFSEASINYGYNNIMKKSTYSVRRMLTFQGIYSRRKCIIDEAMGKDSAARAVAPTA